MAASSVGNTQRNTPIMTISVVGISIMIPISREIRVGVPQPIFAIGAITKTPFEIGNIC
ncbi:hypothetical protein D3C79_997120 [compost metagenome]